MLKRLMIGLTILVLFSACQSEKSPTNVVTPNPYFTSQQSVKSSSKGCQACGDTSVSVDTAYFVEGSDKNKAIADLLKDWKYKTLRKFLMKNLQVRQDIPNAKVFVGTTESQEEIEMVEVPFVNFDGTKDKAVSILQVIKGDTSKIGALITTFDKNTLPSNLQTMAVYVDPCVYMQMDGGCEASPFYSSGFEVDSTGTVVPTDISPFWRCVILTVGPTYYTCAIGCMESTLAYSLCFALCCGGGALLEVGLCRWLFH